MELQYGDKQKELKMMTSTSKWYYCEKFGSMGFKQQQIYGKIGMSADELGTMLQTQEKIMNLLESWTNGKGQYVSFKAH